MIRYYDKGGGAHTQSKVFFPFLARFLKVNVCVTIPLVIRFKIHFQMNKICDTHECKLHILDSKGKTSLESQIQAQGLSINDCF